MDGEAAWLGYQQYPFPLVIIDWHLPSISGLDLCKNIRATHIGQYTTIVVITASNKPEDLKRALLAGANDYIIKPLNIDLLKIRLEIAEHHAFNALKNKRLNERLSILEKAVETMRLGVTISDLDTNIQYVNPAQAHMLGYAAADLIGQKATQFFPIDKESLTNNLTSKTIHRRLEHKISYKNQHTFPAQILSDIVSNAQGDNIGVVTICEDITERKRAEEQLQTAYDQLEKHVHERTAELWQTNRLLQQEINERKKTEEALRESERRLREMLENFQLISVLLDVEGNITFCNEYLLKLSGYTKEELLGQNWFKLMIWPQDDNRVANSFYEKILTGTIATYAENFIITKQGTQRLIFWNNLVLRDIHGQPLGTASIGVDITNQKLAENALRESEEKYRLLFEKNPHPILVYDLETFFFLAVNESAIKTYGYSPAEFSTMKITDLRSQENHWLLEELQRLTHTPVDMVAEKHQRKDRSIIDVEMRSYRLMFSGRPANIVLANDITERRKAEEALQFERALLAKRVEGRTAELSAANAQLAKASRLKDEFLASMSHELRTPLNGILGLSDALQEEVYGTLTEKQFKCLRSIEESGRHLLSLINDLLDLSKMEAGKLNLNISAVDVNAICQASLNVVKQLAENKDITIWFTTDEQVSIIPADERRLKQILLNLLSNAIKFTPEGGSVGLEAIFDPTVPAINFSVWDTGIGIAPEDLSRLFQPFVQLDSNLTRQHAGTGLGLALVYKMVEMHGGSVFLESKLGKSSRFTISLPYREKISFDSTDESLEKISEEQLAMIELTLESNLPLILLAEDNELNIDWICDYLSSKAYRLKVALNGREAVERAKEEIPKLIILDMQMPILDGFTTMTIIREDEHLKNIPIIALSALVIEGDQEKCLSAGANAYLTKPLNLELLNITIASLIGRNHK